MNIRYDKFFAVALGYLALPVLIFFIFFLKPVWAVLFSGALVFCLVLAVKDVKNADYSLLKDRSNTTYVGPVLLSVMAVISLIWAYMSGMGEFTWTTADHTVRAAVLNDLVNYRWPVIYDMSTQLNPAVSSSLPEGTATFAYYFTFWLVPAGIGKLFGVFAARVALVIWGAIGLFLTMVAISIMQKKASWTVPFLFIFFSGIDIIPYEIKTSILHKSSTWEGWNGELWVHGNLYQTMNTFHQSIPGWLITALVIDSRSNKHIGTVGALMFAYSPWATIGLLPIAIYELLANKWKNSEGKRSLKNIFSVGNLVIPSIIMVVFALFYTANTKATSIKGFIWTFFDKPMTLLWIYVGYVAIEFGIWALLVYKDNAHNGLYWTALITLLIFPIYKMSEANDLLMRGTLAPMFVIFVLALGTFDRVLVRFKNRGKNNDFKALGLFAVIFAMAIVPFFFMTTVLGATKQIYSGEDTSKQPKDEIVSFGNIANEEFTAVTERQFFVFEYEDQLFYKVFGKS